MKKLWKTGLSFVITLFFLYLAFRKVNANEFWTSLQKSTWEVVIGASLMAVLSIALRAWRWQILIMPIKHIPYKSMLSFSMIGFMANNLLPARAGEFIRAYLVGKKENISGLAAFATVFIERLFDMLALMLLLFYVLIYAPLPEEVKYAGFTLGGVSLLLLVFFIFLAPSDGKIRSGLMTLAAKLPEQIRAPILKKLRAFLMGLDILQRWQKLFALILLSVLIWIQMSITIYLIFKGFSLHLDSEMHFWIASNSVLVFLAFAVSVPTAPGYFGITQWAFIFILRFFDISQVDALGTSVVFNLTQYIPITGLGIFFLFREGLTLTQLSVKEKTTNLPEP